eukprot:6084012-Amphidinium_carterae.2
MGPHNTATLDQCNDSDWLSWHAATFKVAAMPALAVATYTEKQKPTTNTIQNKRKTISFKSIGIHQNTWKMNKTVSTKGTLQAAVNTAEAKLKHKTANHTSSPRTGHFEQDFYPRVMMPPEPPERGPKSPNPQNPPFFGGLS